VLFYSKIEPLRVIGIQNQSMYIVLEDKLLLPTIRLDTSDYPNKSRNTVIT